MKSVCCLALTGKKALIPAYVDSLFSFASGLAGNMLSGH